MKPGIRTVTALIFVLNSPFAAAQWTITVLHPYAVSPYGDSTGTAAYGNKQGGQGPDGANSGAMWLGTAESYVNLRPSETLGYSYVSAMNESHQGGVVKVLVEGSLQEQAALWNGSGASYINMNPNGAMSSGIAAMSSSQQGGHAKFGEVVQAGIWSGTPESWVSLHPSGAEHSRISAMNETQQGGSAWFGGVIGATLWSGTADSWTSLHPAVASSSRVQGMSASRQGGIAIIGGVNHAALWSGTAASFLDLHPPGATESEVYGVTEDFAAGSATYAGKRHAVIWRGTPESAVDLHGLVTQALGTEFTVSVIHAATTYGDSTHFVGYALSQSGIMQNVAVMWTYTARDFAAWAQAKFTPEELADSNLSGPTAVYSQDGLPNLVKFALGLEPKQAITSGLPAVAVTPTEWTYTYSRPSGVLNVAYEVEISTDLVNWTTEGVVHEMTGATINDQSWSARYPLDSTANIFFRLKITRTDS